MNTRTCPKVPYPTPNQFVRAAHNPSYVPKSVIWVGEPSSIFRLNQHRPNKYSKLSWNADTRHPNSVGISHIGRIMGHVQIRWRIWLFVEDRTWRNWRLLYFWTRQFLFCVLKNFYISWFFLLGKPESCKSSEAPQFPRQTWTWIVWKVVWLACQISMVLKGLLGDSFHPIASTISFVLKYWSLPNAALFVFLMLCVFNNNSWFVCLTQESFKFSWCLQR